MRTSSSQRSAATIALVTWLGLPDIDISAPLSLRPPVILNIRLESKGLIYFHSL